MMDEITALITRMFPSLLLAPSFVVLMVCIHFYAPEEKKLWSFIGLSFTPVYVVMVTIPYYIQLTMVVPLLLEVGSINSELVLFDYQTFLYAVDVLGYTFMSLAMLFATPVFKNQSTLLQKLIYWSFIVVGLLAFVLPFQMLFFEAFYIGISWAVAFPVSTICLALFFKNIE
jgi:hypothetical protein